jgi:hypothetical protein
MLAAPTCRADIVVSEGFDYADGSVGGGEENGGTGWAGAWEASSSVNTPPNEFTIQSAQAIFTGNGANQEAITHSRQLASPLTVGAGDIVVIDFDLIIGPSDGQIGRGIGVNFVSGDSIAFTLGKRINANIGVWDNGILSSSVRLSDAEITRTAGTTYNLSATVTYDGVDTAMTLTDGATTLSAVLAATQVTIDTVELAGYHSATTGNGIDNLSIDVIPEPGTMVLIGLGAAGLLLRRRRA